MPSVNDTSKPKVLALGYPSYAGDSFMQSFESSFRIDVVEPTTRARTVADLAAKVASSGPYDALLVRMGIGPYEPFDKELLQPLVPHCKILVSASAGYNEFDVEWMTENGMWFCNTRSAVSEATADMAIFLILSILKDASRAEKSARSGLWRADHSPTTDPSGLTLGIVGLGGIGRHLALKASVFNMKVKYYNRTRLDPEMEAKYSATYCPTLHSLLSASDVVSINCPLNASTTGLISIPEFSAMKDGVFFVNTSRGPVVDEKALIAALESGKVKRAGLDVFEKEPEINSYFMNSDRCTIQPHLGGLTDGSWKKAERECLENIRSLFEQGRPVAPVNEINAK